MDPSSTHHVACGLLVRADRVFLVHRSPAKTWYPNVWDLPGGHVEPGQSGAQALVRELREELGIEIAPPVGAALVTIQKAHLRLEIWRVDAWQGTVVNAAPDEHDAVGWFTGVEARALELADARYPALFNLVLPHSFLD